MITTRNALVAAALATGWLPLSAPAAPEVGPTGNYYEVVSFTTSPKTWDAADADAQSRFHRGFQGYLATITSYDEDLFIEQRRQAANLSPGEAWVGGKQGPDCSPEPKCDWNWVNGEGPVPTENGGPGYANWLPYPLTSTTTFEPNDLNGNEDHLAVGLGGNFGWNDEGALGNIGGYVVEYPGLVATDDTAEATSGVPKSIDVIANDMLGTGATVASVQIVSAPTAGGPTPAVGPAPDFLVTYQSPTDFPDETGDTDSFEYKVTDQYGAFAIATVTVTVIADQAVVEPGINQVIFNQAQNPSPNSNNPMTAAYSQVLEGGGGEVTISCCRVLDTREGAGRRGSYLARELDLGLALNDPANNQPANDGNCIDMPEIPQGMAVLRPWQRGVPLSQGLIDVGDPPSAYVRENDLGVCVIESTGVVSRGVVFSAEEASNVLGYSLNGAVETLRYRPFTGGVSIDPAEADNPYVLPWTAEWDESRSGKRYSTNVMVVNLWHEWLLLPSVPYLLNIAGGLRHSINEVELACPVANTDGFLDDLQSRLSAAMVDILVAGLPWRRQSSGEAAVAELQDFTRLALLASPDADDYGDPLASCPDNPEGLLVGRSMALTHAVCSELVNTFGDATVFSDEDFVCRIPDDILCELPPLPGFDAPDCD